MRSLNSFIPLFAFALLVTEDVRSSTLYFAGDGSALNAAGKYGSSASGPFNASFVSGNVIGFGVANGTGTGASVTVTGFLATENFTLTSASGTISNTSNGVVPIDVSAGKTLDFGSQGFTTAGTAGYIKNGEGVLALTGGAYGGGFTLNAGTVILRGVNSLGSNATTNPLVLNGGIVASNATRDLSGKFGGGITIGGNVQFGNTTGLASPSANLTFNNNISLGGTTRTLTLGNAGVVTLSGVISNTDSSGITFAATSGGTGRFDIINTGNSFNGPVTIAGGEVRFSQQAFGNINTTLVIDGGRLATVFTSPYNIGSNHSIQVGATAGTAISLISTGTMTYNGVISNKSGSAGILVKQGVGTLELGGVSTYTGNTIINNGSVQLTGDNRLPVTTVLSLGEAGSANLGTLNLTGANQAIAGLNSIAGTYASTANNTITATSAATLTINPGSSTSYSYGDGTSANSGVITGAIKLIKSGAGAQTLGDVNAYTGGTEINGGTLTIANAAALGTAGTISFGGGTLRYSGLTTDLSSRFSNADDQAYSIDTNGSNVVLATALHSAGGSLAKLGSGTLTLPSANTYTGTTVIGGGTLIVGGAPTGQGNYSFGPLTTDATLGGINSIGLAAGKTISVVGTSNSARAIISPGTLPGEVYSLNIGGAGSNGVTFGAFGTLALDVGSEWEVLDITGSLNAASTTSRLALTLTAPSLGRYTLATYSAGYTYTGNSASNGGFGEVTGLNSSYRLGVTTASGDGLTGKIELVHVGVLTTISSTGFSPAVVLGGTTTNFITVQNTAPAGSDAVSFNGTSLAVGQTASGPGGSFTGTTVGPGTVNVYDHAAPSVPVTFLDLGRVRVGAALGGSLSVSNAAGYRVNLAGSTTPQGGLSLTSINSLAPGASTSIYPTLDVGSAVLGAFDRTFTYAFGDSSGLPGASSVGSSSIRLTGSIYSGNGVWNSNGSGLWNDPAKWTSGGGLPGLDLGFNNTDTATFAEVAGMMAPVTVTLDSSNPSLRGITFAGSTGYLIAPGSGGTLTLRPSISSGGPDLIVTGGNHMIEAPVVTAGTLTATIAAASQLSIFGGISEIGGARQLYKSGPGTLVLSGANTYTGGNVVSEGILQISGAGNLGGTSGSLTIAGGTLDMGGTTQTVGVTYISSGTIQNGILNFSSFTIAGNSHVSIGLAGSGPVSIEDEATVSLGDTTGYSGPATINGGTVNVATPFAPGASVVVNTGGSLNLLGTSLTVSSLTIAGGSVNTGAYSINSTGAVHISGDATVTLGAGQTISGSTVTISGGSITGGAVTATSAFAFDTATAVDSSADYSGSVGATISGGGTTTLSGNNTYAGPTSISGGSTLKAGSGTAISPNSALSFGAGHGTLDLDGRSATVQSLTGTAGDVVTSSGGVATVNGGSFGGAITGGVGLTKATGGVLILSGPNSYSGPTLVEGGKLLVNGSLTASSEVTVATGGTLGGSGTIAGDTVIESGGTLSPGNSPGVMNYGGNLDLDSGSSLVMELAGAPAGGAGTSFDQINVGGTLTYGGTLSVVSFGGFTPASLGLGSSGSAIYPLFLGLKSEDFQAVTVFGISLSNAAGIWASGTTGDGLRYQFNAGDGTLAITAVPEPGEWAAAMVGTLAVMIALRRRKLSRRC